MSEDKLTHVLVPLEWLNRISATSTIYIKENFEHINLDAQQSYIKQLEDALNEITDAPMPYNEVERYSWVETAKAIAKQPLQSKLK